MMALNRNKKTNLILALSLSLGAALFLNAQPAQAQSEEKTDGVDCSHLTPEQMGDKNACWTVKKAEMGFSRPSTEGVVEIVNELPQGTSLVNVTQPILTDETNLNIYLVPQFKSAVPSSLAPSGDSGDKRPGNQ